VAYEHIEHKLAWRTHRDVEASRAPFYSILPADGFGKTGFAAAVAAFRQLRVRSGGLTFDGLVRMPSLDGILLAASRKAMDAAAEQQ
jgi:hypothetical protein